MGFGEDSFSKLPLSYRSQGLILGSHNMQMFMFWQRPNCLMWERHIPNTTYTKYCTQNGEDKSDFPFFLLLREEGWFLSTFQETRSLNSNSCSIRPQLTTRILGCNASQNLWQQILLQQLQWCLRSWEPELVVLMGLCGAEYLTEDLNRVSHM